MKKTSGNIWKLCFKVLTFAPAFENESSASWHSSFKKRWPGFFFLFLFASLSTREMTRKEKKRKIKKNFRKYLVQQSAGIFFFFACSYFPPYICWRNLAYFNIYYIFLQVCYDFFCIFEFEAILWNTPGSQKHYARILKIFLTTKKQVSSFWKVTCSRAFDLNFLLF